MNATLDFSYYMKLLLFFQHLKKTEMFIENVGDFFFLLFKKWHIFDIICFNKKLSFFTHEKKKMNAHKYKNLPSMIIYILLKHYKKRLTPVLIVQVI